MKSKNKVVEETVKETVTVKTDNIMRLKNGQRIHLMNINMKNKILESMNWVEDAETFNDKANKFNSSMTKYFSRLLEELKTYNMNPTSDKLIENHGEKTGSRCRYYLLKSNKQMYIVENNKDRTVRRYMVIEQ